MTCQKESNPHATGCAKDSGCCRKSAKNSQPSEPTSVLAGLVQKVTKTNQLLAMTVQQLIQQNERQNELLSLMESQLTAGEDEENPPAVYLSD